MEPFNLVVLKQTWNSYKKTITWKLARHLIFIKNYVFIFKMHEEAKLIAAFSKGLSHVKAEKEIFQGNIYRRVLDLLLCVS